MRRSRERDRVHLLRMRDAAQYALQFAAGREIEELDTDIQFRMALVKAVELIGESASRTSDELRIQQPQISWTKMIGMRNVLVHNYWAIEQGEFWEAVQSHIPPLIAQLESILAAED